MLNHEYDTMREVEDGYWWYQVLRQITVEEVSMCSGGRGRLKLLDAGCGTGGTLDWIAKRHGDFELHGVDLSTLAVEHTKKRGFTNVEVSSVETLPYPDNFFDGLVSLDVLYHEGLDEEKALAEFYRVLKPGGFLILNLPAFDALRGRHDIAVGGARRYTANQVRFLTHQQGFTTAKIHYWNAWLFFPILLWRRFTLWITREGDPDAKSDLKPLSLSLSRILRRIGLVDAKMSAALGIPFGTSVFSVALKGSPR